MGLTGWLKQKALMGYWSSNVNKCHFLQVETILLNNLVETDGYLYFGGGGVGKKSIPSY